MENFSKYNWIEKVHESGVNSGAKNIGFGFFRFTFQGGLSVKVTKNQLCRACGYEEDSEAGRKFAQRGIKALENAGYLVRVAEGASAGRSRLGMDEPAVWRLALPGTVAVDSAFKDDGLTDKSVRKRAEGESLTDKSVRYPAVDDVLTDKSVRLTDKSVPPNTLELYKDHTGRDSSKTGPAGSADAGKDGKAVEVPTFEDLLSAYPDSIHTKKDARNGWERLTDDEKRRAVRAARKVQPNEPAYVTGLGKWIREKKADWPLMPEDMYAAALNDPSSIGDLLRATGLSGPAIRWDDRPRDVAVREDNLAWLRENESMILTHLNR